jgi:hypothetical protein
MLGLAGPRTLDRDTTTPSPGGRLQVTENLMGKLDQDRAKPSCCIEGPLHDVEHLEGEVPSGLQ